MKPIFAFLVATSVFAQTSALAPVPRQQPLGNSGQILTTGCLYTYSAGTTTPQATYSDSTLSTQNTNPIILDASGRALAIYWNGTAIKMVLGVKSAGSCPATPGGVLWSQDNIIDTGLALKAALAAGGGATLVDFTPTGGSAITIATALNSAFIYDQGFSSAATACASTKAVAVTKQSLWNALSTLNCAAKLWFPVGVGVTLKPASAQTVTISPLSSCPLTQQCFDLSAGGSVVYSSPPAVVSPDQWGGDVTGMNAATAAVNAAFAACSHTKFTPGGIYLIDGAIAVSSCATVSVDATGAKLDCSTSATNYCPAISGTLGTGQALTSNTAKGAATFATTALVSVGQMFLLSSTTQFDTVLGSNSGELGEVCALSGTTITPCSPLIDAYIAANTTVYPITPVQGQWTGGTIVRDPTAATSGLEVLYARNFKISGLTVTGAKLIGIFPSYWLGGQISTVNINEMLSVAAGSNYGVICGTCQGTVLGPAINASGGRAGIDLGGSGTEEPNRFVTIIGNMVSTLAGGFAGIGIHGNSDSIKVVDNSVTNGIQTAGSNMIISGNTITSPGANATCIALQPERNSDYFLMRDNTCTQSATGWSWQPILTPQTTGIIRSSMVFVGGTQGGVIGVGAGNTATLTSLVNSDNISGQSSFAFEAAQGAGSTFTWKRAEFQNLQWQKRVFFDSSVTASSDITFTGGFATENATNAIQIAAGCNTLTMNGTTLVNTGAASTLITSVCTGATRLQINEEGTLTDAGLVISGTTLDITGSIGATPINAIHGTAGIIGTAPPDVFANITGSNAAAGFQIEITDADTNTWGASIGGSSTNKVMALADGANVYRVMGK